MDYRACSSYNYVCNEVCWVDIEIASHCSAAIQLSRQALQSGQYYLVCKFQTYQNISCKISGILWYLNIHQILKIRNFSLCIYLSTYWSKPGYSLKGHRRKHSANEVQFQQVMNGRKRTCWVFIVNVLAVSSLTTLESTWELLSSLNSRVISGKKEIKTTITQYTWAHVEQWHFRVWCILNVWQYQKQFIHELFI